MANLLLVLLVLVSFSTLLLSHQYCIIGAGPSGMQLGYFLQTSGRDYVIFERNSTSGSFFRQYPRHRKLISINKRYTGSTNEEFNLRHDWNSLLSHHPDLKMKHYSKDYFPHADTAVKYFEDFSSKLGLNIQYNTEIKKVKKDLETGIFTLTDQLGKNYNCQVLIISTGLWKPHIPEIPGIELIEGYENVSVDPDDFINKAVFIIGRGNAGFETAANIVGSAAFIHMASRSRIKMAYQTHYVGDLRAINDDLIDTYQLKSLDGQSEIYESLDSKIIIKDGKYYIIPASSSGKDFPTDGEVSVGFYFPYDSIIRCTGFKFDYSLFDKSTDPGVDQSSHGKFPLMKSNYESVLVPDMYFTGVISHAVDYKKSAGGFIHGFRYTARALYRQLEWRYHAVKWPSVRIPVSDLTLYLIKRINEVSGLYQMFNVLGDLMIIENNDTVIYLEEVPIQSLGDIKSLTGYDAQQIIILNFEYGIDYSGPGEDVLRENRATGNPVEADTSNFLHPVLYHYNRLPLQFREVGVMPKPTSYHHIVEDFLTDWTSRQADIIPVRRFIEDAVQSDLRSFSTDECFELSILYGTENIPLYCKQHYFHGTSFPNINIDMTDALQRKLKNIVQELY
ncbi:PREDICTED: FAD-dependent oxidoreductase domain-containing protein 2-like [Amphimedon queenslandica]|uniref:FAD/NAD(P)-binding domain-containing protein n=1 Tax=Amphimedon queenslandica TaxID=400682 RepID=A0A1X7V7N8_AMPQE|nr:PREDICTED: FAD-dependent oxidoreductase domain-containing protein 2-like [Amphimedon queenslandica]|eukprot:XP_003385457.1 PREDICTED: FAD-dependent oxidoreductase domain-containing protein 2-like [Amphimedon queenslandica]